MPSRIKFLLLSFMLCVVLLPIDNLDPDVFKLESSFYQKASDAYRAYAADLMAGQLVGRIQRTGVRGYFHNFDASCLPVKARIYQYRYGDAVLLVETNGQMIPYLQKNYDGFTAYELSTAILILTVFLLLFFFILFLCSQIPTQAITRGIKFLMLTAILFAFLLSCPPLLAAHASIPREFSRVFYSYDIDQVNDSRILSQKYPITLDATLGITSDDQDLIHQFFDIVKQFRLVRQPPQEHLVGGWDFGVDFRSDESIFRIVVLHDDWISIVIYTDARLTNPNNPLSKDFMQISHYDFTVQNTKALNEFKRLVENYLISQIKKTNPQPP